MIHLSAAIDPAICKVICLVLPVDERRLEPIKCSNLQADLLYIGLHHSKALGSPAVWLAHSLVGPHMRQ